MKLVRQSLFVLVAGCLVAMSTAAKAQWVAYNDFSWLAESNLIFGQQGGFEKDPDYRTTPGDANSGLDKVTLFTHGNFDVGTGTGTFVDSTDFYSPDLAVEAPQSDGQQARSGFLRNYDSGAATGVGVNVTHTGQTFNWATQQGATFAETPGSDAYDAFWDDNGNAIIGLWGTVDGDDTNGTHTVTLSNLDPSKTYEYTTAGNFGGWGGSSGGVQWRWTKIEGHDPSGFQNLSSVDTDYATAVNVFNSADPNDSRNSVGHEQRAAIRNSTDPSHYVQASGEVWFDGWVTKFQFKPGADGTVDIVTKGIANVGSMEQVFVDTNDANGNDLGFSADTAGVPVWSAGSTATDPNDPAIHTAHTLTRDLANLKNGSITNPAHPLFGRHYGSGWREHSDPSEWAADPDALELTVGMVKDSEDPTTANARFYLSGFKFEELAAAIANADFNGDGDIDGNDFLTWQRNLGSGSSLAQGDANGDSVVDAADLAIWGQQYGQAAASTASSVPEPSTLLLVFSALLTCCQVRRNKV